MGDDSSQADFQNYPMGSPLQFNNMKPSSRAQVPSMVGPNCPQATLNVIQERDSGGIHFSMPSRRGMDLGLLRSQV